MDPFESIQSIPLSKYEYRRRISTKNARFIFFFLFRFRVLYRQTGASETVLFQWSPMRSETYPLPEEITFAMMFIFSSEVDNIIKKV